MIANCKCNCCSGDGSKCPIGVTCAHCMAAGRKPMRGLHTNAAADAPLAINRGVLGLTGAGRASFARDDDQPMAPRGVLADPDPETLANQVHVFVADGRDSKGPYALVRGRGFRKVRPPARNAEAADAPLRPTTGVFA